jgi:hypothetical protein
MDQIIEPIKSDKGFWDYIEVLNNNKYFVGIIMILLNLGSKYISVELSQSQEKILGSPVIRRLILFTVFFTATRDIWISFLLTAAFVILVGGIFNDDSEYCLIPKRYRSYDYDTNQKISEQDIAKAKEILSLSEKQEKKQNNNIEQFTKMKRKNYKNNMNKLSFISKMNIKFI